MKKTILMTLAALLLTAATASAVPTLQIYIDGGTYDAERKTWVTTSNHFNLWVIGSDTPIYDVYLATAFSSNETGTITFTPTVAGSVTDPSTPTMPQWKASGIGTIPLGGDGKPLPSHGVYGADTSWNSYLLGTFNLQDSPLANYDASVETTLQKGQINAYTVDITGYSTVHFDAYDHIYNAKSGNYKYVGTPNSHDGESDIPSTVPEPGSVLLFGCGLLGLAIYGKRRQNC